MNAHPHRKVSINIYTRTISLLALAATITWLSGTSGPQVPGELSIPHFDKWAHFFIYGLLATQFVRLRGDGAPSLGRIIFVVLAVTGFGLSDELHQYSNELRTFEWADLGADAAGALVACIAYRGWGFYRNCLNSRPFSWVSGILSRR